MSGRLPRAKHATKSQGSRLSAARPRRSCVTVRWGALWGWRAGVGW